MTTHLSMVFDQRNNYLRRSKFTTTIAGLSRNSQTHQFNSLMFLHDKPKNICSKETSAELKLVQEYRSINTKNNVGVEPSSPNIDDEFPEAQPLSEEPVSFHFGDDYGNQLFLDLQVELENNRPFHGGRGMNNAVEGTNYSSDDVYILSPESGMINLFLRDNLF